MQWKRFILAALTASVVAGCRGSAPQRPQQPTLISIDIAPPDSSYQVGSTQQLTTTAHYSDGTTKNVMQSTAWSSSNTSAAASEAHLGKTANAQVAVMDVPGVFTRQYGSARTGLNSDEPAAVNGQVFVGAQGQLDIYGLLPQP